MLAVWRSGQSFDLPRQRCDHTSGDLTWPERRNLVLTVHVSCVSDWCRRKQKCSNELLIWPVSALLCLWAHWGDYAWCVTGPLAVHCSGFWCRRCAQRRWVTGQRSLRGCEPCHSPLWQCLRRRMETGGMCRNICCVPITNSWVLPAFSFFACCPNHWHSVDIAAPFSLQVQASLPFCRLR